MASSSDVAKKVMRFKLQLADTAESATVVNILQKLKNLDITVDILSETGIGKTVNSLRRHEQAGEIAKSLVRGWKGLVPKESTSHTEDGKGSERVSAKDKLGDINCPNNGSVTLVDLNHNCLSQGKSRDSSDEASSLKPWKRKADSVKPQCEEQKRHKDQNMKGEKRQQESQNVKQNDLLQKKTEIHEDEMDNSVISKKKNNDQSNREYGDDSTLQKSRSDSREKFKSSSDNGRFEPDKESQKKSKRSKESSKEVKESLPFESSDKNCTMLKLSSVKEDRSPGSSRSPEAHNKKRKKMGKEKHTALNYEQESENKGHSRNKKAKTKHYDGDEAPKEPTISFESCLDYDCNVLKRKEKSGVKKPPKKIKTVVKEETWSMSSPGLKALKSPVMSLSVASSKQKFKESIMDLMSIPLPAILPECENPSTVEYFERNVEKESDCCEVSEEYAGFTGQRLYKKMQVYSGAKTVFLPTMMSLHQQCIRTLQNNINRECRDLFSVLYETGGVPFEILEPVLERCTPEQLLRIEEFNPMYIGVTDHLWGKHCQRDFKHSKLQEYESWKEMYTRLSEERERKLHRLTKTIVSANSIKPKGRQVKMAFIHTVAKPPRDVRIQQEIHGTAVQQPHQPRCSVKVQENRVRPSCNEPSRSSSTSSGAANTQDLRKKTRVAPMMAKSLKAFKKQLGRR